MTGEETPEPARVRRILTIRCIACDSKVAHVLALTEDHGEAHKYLEFRSTRQVLRADGKWQTKRADSWFAEPLEVERGTGMGQTLAHCRRHSHWVQHAAVLAALGEGVKVLKVVPANNPGT